MLRLAVGVERLRGGLRVSVLSAPLTHHRVKVLAASGDQPYFVVGRPPLVALTEMAAGRGWRSVTR